MPEKERSVGPAGRMYGQEGHLCPIISQRQKAFLISFLASANNANNNPNLGLKQKPDAIDR